MATWTVALFGHNKPRDIGWEKRAMPGDVIAYKPIDQEDRWTPTERAEFLIVTIDGPSQAQMEALCEPFWDTSSYHPYEPLSYDDFVLSFVDSRIIDKSSAYAKYLEMMLENSRLPTTYLKKRRFNIPLETLKSAGVDEVKMLDRELLYSPKLPTLPYTESFDKMKSRNVQVSDGLNLIKARTNEEILKLGVMR